MKRRTVILLGAGAAIPWGAPTTKEITEKICSDTTFRTLSGQPIGAWFYDKLIHYYHKNPDTVNFETILNCVDLLSSFFLSYLNGPSFPEFEIVFPVLFKENEDIVELLAFDRIYGQAKLGRWESHNEKIKFYGFWSDFDSFFKYVHKLFIKIIASEIRKYEQNCLDKQFSIISGDLNNMLNELASNSIVRSYTLNYDRLLKRISPIDFYEGVSTDETEKVIFDSKKVLNEQNMHSFYSLHGNVDNFDIIAGLNKSARILDKPYSQFYHAFYRDCINADTILIIGYSFSDTHINRAIIEGSSIQNNQKIFCVGLHKLENDINFDNQSQYDLFKLDRHGNFGKFMGGNHCLYNIANNENADRIFYFRKGYKNFLMWKGWKQF